MKRKLLLILALSLILIPGLVAKASVVSGAYYLTTIRVSNTSTATTLVSTNFTLSTADMITQGMLNASATDAVMRDASGNDVAFMPGWSTNPWVTWVPTIGANSQINQYLYSDNASGGKIRYFPGLAGMTVSDAANLEPGANFTLTFSSALLDTTSTGAGKDLLYKLGALRVYVSDTTSGNITAWVFGGGSYAYVGVGGVPSGEYEITLHQDGVHLWLNVGSFVSTNETAIAVDNSINNWAFTTGDSLTYVRYIEVKVGGNQRGFWSWQYAATFTDQSGNGNTATPTFRTTSSDADVSALVISQEPTEVSTGPGSASGAGVDLIGSTPSEPSGIYSTGAGDFPGKAILVSLANNNNIPSDAVIAFIAFGSVALAFVVVFALTHNPRVGLRGSLLFAAFAAGGVMVYWYRAGGGVIQGWIFIPFGVAIIMLLLWKNPNTTPV